MTSESVVTEASVKIEASETSEDEAETLEFSTPGKCDDEIILEFEDESKRLHVSRNVLCRSSPVFKAMFSHSSEESKTGIVHIEDYSIEEFNEFLLCIDPGTLNEVTINNVTSILSIADKYLNDPLKMKCQKVMQLWLDDLHIRASKVKLYEQPEYVMTMFTLLKAAIGVSALGVIHRAQTFIASFGSILFIGPLWRKAEYTTGSDANNLQKQDQEECCKMFQDLPAEIQSKILQFRLRKTDFNEYLLNKK